jgi:hypothetical protein
MKTETVTKASLLLFVLLASTAAMAQRCDSISASFSGGWRPASSAPRDGTIVEMMQTFGTAPWYGRFRWTKNTRDAQPSWRNVDDLNGGVTENACLFWRPYKGKGKYVDPTGGVQKTVAYWCAWMHRPYDPKTDACK